MPVLPTPYLLFTKARTDQLLTDSKAYTKAKAQCKKEFASLTDEDLLYWIDEAEYEEDFYLVIILITRSLAVGRYLLIDPDFRPHFVRLLNEKELRLVIA